MDLVEINKSNSRRHPWELARLEVLLEIINDHLPESGTKRILDIGCGDCFFAEEMLKRRDDVEIIGVDPAYTEEKIRVKIKEVDNKRFKLYSNIEKAKENLTSAPVHFILLLDVIEHMENDVSFLTGIITEKYITDETLLLITVPAFQSLFSGHDLFLKHYRRYSSKSLKQCISSVGFTPIRSGYFFLSLLPIRILQKTRTMLGMKQTQKGAGLWKQPDWLTNLFKNYLLFDYHCCKTMHKAGISLPGLSVYSVCKKRV